MKHLLRTALACCLLFITAYSVKAQAYITDTTFGIAGIAQSVLLNNSTSNINFGVSNIFRQPDNKILVCGYAYYGANNYYSVMYRINCDGSPDNTFGNNGLVRHRFLEKTKPFSYTLMPSGKIIAVGQASTSLALASQVAMICRYNSNGTPDSSFADNGFSQNDGFPHREYLGMFPVSNNKYLCTRGLSVVRCFNSGIIDSSFGTNGLVNIPTPSGFTEPVSSTLQPFYKSVMRSDGKIITSAPSYFQAMGTHNVALFCYDTLGVMDPSFGTNGFFKDNSWECPAGPALLLLQSDDKVIAVREYGFFDKVVIKRIKTNGTIDSTFGTNGQVNIVASNPPLGLLHSSILSDNSFLVGYLESDGLPVKFKKFSPNGTEVGTFSLNGGNSFQFGSASDMEYPELGISSSNNEFILAGLWAPDMSGHISLTKFVEAATLPNITLNGNTLSSNVTNSGATFQWYFNGSPITNATGPTVQVTQNGVYMVEVQNSWGCTQSDDIELTTVGIHNTSAPVLPALYPNPVENTLNIAATGHFQVLDLTGQVLMELNSTQTLTRIDVNHLPAGLYMLQTNTGSQTHYQRFIKQ